MPVDENADGMGQEFSRDAMGQVPSIPRPDFLEMKLRSALADDRFHQATDARKLADNPRGARVNPVSSQGGLQVDSDANQFRLKPGAEVSLVADHHALKAQGQLPERLPFISGRCGHGAGGDQPTERDQEMAVKPS